MVVSYQRAAPRAMASCNALYAAAISEFGLTWDDHSGSSDEAWNARSWDGAG